MTGQIVPGTEGMTFPPFGKPQREDPSEDEVRAERARKRWRQQNRIAKQLDTTGHDRRVMLKIKLGSLAEEARIIRREEQKRLMGDIRVALWKHRTQDVRFEARAAHLAYGIMRGLDIEQMERNWDDPTKVSARPRSEPASPIEKFNFYERRRKLCLRVLDLLRKYGKPAFKADSALPQWLTDGLQGGKL